MVNRERPNLIVFMAEGMPPGAIAALGNPSVNTPNLDRLAARSAVFSHAYCTQPLCTPARASLFTGHYPHVTCPDNEHILPPDAACVPELADFSEYQCAMIGKWDLGDEPRAQHGFAHWRSIDASRHDRYSRVYGASRPTDYEAFIEAQGYHPDKPLLQRGNDPHSWFTERPQIPERFSPDAYAADEACSFIEQNEQEPFMLWLPFLRTKPGPFEDGDRVHDPSNISLPETFDVIPDTHWHLKERLMAFQNREKKPEQWRRDIANCLDKVSLIDRYVGQVLDTFERRGLADDTIVVFTADHGLHLGEHRLNHKVTMTEESMRVPLLLHIPGVVEKRRDIEEPVSHIDLLPTLLESMGNGVPDHLPGTSLLPVLRGDISAPEEDVVVEWNGASAKGVFLQLCRRMGDYGPRWRGPSIVELAEAWTEPRRTVITPDLWKYTHSPVRGEHMLFNLREDPGETRNLVHEPSFENLTAELRRRLDRWCERTNDDSLERWYSRGRYADGFLD